MNNSSIYREALLEHIKNPKNLGSLANPDLKAKAYNPICGDELELSIELTGEKIKDCRTKVRGCSICIVSASMMSELIILKKINEVEKIRKKFLECLKKENYEIPKLLFNLRPLISLKNNRSRMKCVILAWDALNDCLSQYEK